MKTQRSTSTLPKNLDRKDVKIFSVEPQTFREVPHVLELTNCVILKYGGVIHNFQLVEESVADLSRHGKHYTLKFFFKSLLQFPKHFFLRNRVILVYDLWSENIFHWLNDVLPRIFTVQAHKGCYFILPVTYRKYDYVNFTLEKLGIKDIYWIEEESFVFARKLRMPEHIGYSGTIHPDLSSRVVEFLLPFRSETSFGDRIYVSRAGANSRKVLNEEDVTRYLSSIGFRIVMLESIAFIDQIAIVSRAKVVVSPHGAGLTHVMFMTPGSKVLELRTNGEPQNNCYFNLAANFDLDYYYLFCESDSVSNNFQEGNMVVELEKLKTITRQMINEN